MKTRRRTRARKSSQRRCLCDCDTTKQHVPVKSPDIKAKKSRNSGKVNRKSSTTTIIMEKPTKKVATKPNLKKQIVNNKNKDNLSPVVILKKSSLSPVKTTDKNSGNIPKKLPYVVLEPLNIKSPTMKLRNNRQKNYCEPPSLHVESINEEPVEKPTTIARIPIYKQQIQDTKKKKKKKNQNNDDQYEFDSDSEEIKHRKRKQRKLNNSSHDEYNKTIENILRNVATKIKKRKHSPAKKTDDNGNNKQKCTQPNKTTQSNRARNIANRNEAQQIIKKTLPIVKDTNPKIDPSKPLPTTQQVAIKDVVLPTSKPVPSTNNDDTFGFLDDDNQELTEIPINETNKTPKVHIISDIKLKPNQQLILSGKTPILRPNANSTMIYNVLTPWRFNEINIKRNPHLIQMKQRSALPSIQQEPVMEYSIIEKLLNSSTPQHRNDVDVDEKNRIVQTPTLRRSPHKPTTPSIQKTIDDYYGDKIGNKENRRVVTRHSLFDIDDLSPIKIDGNNTKSPIMKVNSMKRQILGDLTDRENIIENVQISPPNLLNKTDANRGISNYFGFETSKESTDDSNADKPKDHRPYRVSIRVNDKKYEVKRKAKPVDDDDDDEEEISEKGRELPDRITSDDEEDGDAVKSDLDSLDGAGLFEDLHDSKEKEVEENKVKKKRKVKWLQAGDQKPKKRRKDVRTKKEEEEAERWAEQFNSMCKEVDEFTLEIE